MKSFPSNKLSCPSCLPNQAEVGVPGTHAEIIALNDLYNNSAPGGKHGSTKFHNELKSIIDNSSSMTEFNNRLENLRIRWKIK